MKVTVKLALALAASLALLAGGAPTWAAAAKNTNSEKVAKILKPAQEALQQKKYADALAKIREAQALPEKTPFDQYTIHEFACQANIGAGNYAEAAKECEARLDDQFMPEADKPQMIKLLLGPQLSAQELRQGHRLRPARRQGRLCHGREQELPRAGVLPEGRLEELPEDGGGAGR